MTRQIKKKLRILLQNKKNVQHFFFHKSKRNVQIINDSHVTLDIVKNYVTKRFTFSRLARKASLSPEAWAKCLLGACYSLYFLALPCRLMLYRGKEHATLRAAFELLERATKLRVPCDEVCSRNFSNSRALSRSARVFSFLIICFKIFFYCQ